MENQEGRDHLEKKATRVLKEGKGHLDLMGSQV